MGKSTWGFDELKAELASGVTWPVYLLHGEEDLLREEAEQLIISHMLAEGERGFGLEVLYGGETDAREVLDRASSFPMLSARRVVVVRDVDRMKADGLAPYLASPSDTTCLILTAHKVDLRRNPFKSGMGRGRTVAFPFLYEDRVPGWIRSRVAAAGMSITPEAARLLASSVGVSLREVMSEIEKLMVYVGNRKEISDADVAAVAGMSREFSVFDLQDAVGAGDVGRAVTILDRMLETGESGPGIIVMLTRYFANLWKLQELRNRKPAPDQAKQLAEARLSKFEWSALQAASRSFSSGDIENAFPILCSADERLKSTGTDPRAILEPMIVRLAGPAAAHARR